METVIINNLTQILIVILGGWFGYIQVQTKKRTEATAKENLLWRQVDRRNAELTKCMALNMINPSAHICDIKDAMIKYDEAVRAYDDYMEALRVEQFR